jgi:hypothetical protein
MLFENQSNVVPMLKQTSHNEDAWEIGDKAPYILSPRHQVEGSGKLHIPVALFPGFVLPLPIGP